MPACAPKHYLHDGTVDNRRGLRERSKVRIGRPFNGVVADRLEPECGRRQKHRPECDQS